MFLSTGVPDARAYMRQMTEPIWTGNCFTVPAKSGMLSPGMEEASRLIICGRIRRSLNYEVLESLRHYFACLLRVRNAVIARSTARTTRTTAMTPWMMLQVSATLNFAMMVWIRELIVTTSMKHIGR